MPSVFGASCGARDVLTLIASRWSVLVIYALAHGTKRYSDLEHLIGGISQKMLTQTLRNLERDGLIQRKVYPVVPPKVEYTLTALGQTLVGILQSLCAWAEGNLEGVETARQHYDEVKQSDLLIPGVLITEAPYIGS